MTRDWSNARRCVLMHRIPAVFSTSLTIFWAHAPDLHAIRAFARAPLERLPGPCPHPVRFVHQAACNRSTRRADARGGCCAASPRWVRMRAMAAGSSIRCQHTMKADQVQSRSRHQCRQTLHEFHRRHDVVAGAIAPRRLQFQHHLPGAVHTQPLVCNRGA